MTTKHFYKNITIPVDDLIPYVRNSRTHSPEQVAQIAASIKEFGFTNPILIDENNGIVAGHGRLLAAQKLKMESVPCIVLDGLTDAQKKAYVIADNKLALNAGWDDELLKLEMIELKSANFDLLLTGFDEKEIAKFFEDEDEDSSYTRKIEPPVYNPSDVKPELNDLFEDEKTKKLIADIESSSATAPEKTFLKLAAGRHTVFDFQKIADYYAHSSPEIQSLMEDSALVIVDFGKAIANGYVKVNQEIAEQYLNECKSSNE